MEQGAPVDVFASADQVTMDRAGAFIDPATRADFAGNALVLIMPSDSALALTSPEDLKGEEFKLVAIGNPDSVPVGRYAKGALEAAGLYEPLTPKFVLAETVRQALDYVARGEVQAGFVYATGRRPEARCGQGRGRGGRTQAHQLPHRPFEGIQKQGHGEEVRRLRQGRGRPGHPGQVRLQEAVTLSGRLRPPGLGMCPCGRGFMARKNGKAWIPPSRDDIEALRQKGSRPWRRIAALQVRHSREGGNPCLAGTAPPATGLPPPSQVLTVRNQKRAPKGRVFLFTGRGGFESAGIVQCRSPRTKPPSFV
jgi:hypothetical protein